MSLQTGILNAVNASFYSNTNKSELIKRLREMQFINEVLITLIKNNDMDSTLAAILDLAIQITKSEAGGVLLTDHFTKEARIMLVRGDLSDGQFQSILDKAEFIRKSGAVKDVISLNNTSSCFREMLKADPELLSFISVPLIVERKAIGILVLMHRKNSGDQEHLANYLPQDIATISVFANQAALVLHNTLLKLENGKKEVFLKTIEALVTAIDAKDKYTRNHSKNVAKLAVSLARGLKLSNQEIQSIEYGALLHDIGKIGVPEAILNKNGKLEEDEYEKIKKHPVIGLAILQPVDFLQSTSSIIHYHHERMDGKGYPTGIMGENIPFEARIVSVADAWDAMTSDRSYRKGMPMEQALVELQRHAGSQFDEYMVKVFTRIITKNPGLSA
ncbi:HD-GYP domain-containing protein [Desulforamulus aquiferis]|uniref:HD domain-containing protein n=1 Tax=Desulforamulus aquiferis TaxID=1397668 RepID=A0AAW7ZE76_9FIRM|nr:HD domain-containing phosphohydrolase [Desulforamulus aquiferis]MDO7787554.1 HD domain-containing protein [Desulforamulus aquiferis]RYD01580.1 phosphohydrolase [Desulforamulus aquiferis]